MHDGEPYGLRVSHDVAYKVGYECKVAGGGLWRREAECDDGQHPYITPLDGEEVFFGEWHVGLQVFCAEEP